MAKYLVIASDREMVHVSIGYGTKSYKHGTFMKDDKIASMYPNSFIKIPDNFDVKIEKKEPKKEIVQEPALFNEPETEKRSVGRPKKDTIEEKPKKKPFFKR
jgi:hypothetical protein